VGFLNKIRRVVGQYLLQKKLANIQRERGVFNLDTAQTVGILFEVDSFDDCQEVYNFYTYLKRLKKRITVVGFVEKKEYANFIIDRLDFHYFNNKERNWFLVPNNRHVNDFVKAGFDVVINMSKTEACSLKYIAGVCNAKFKVGRYNTNDVALYDLMISENEKSEINEYIHHVKHYLNIINKNAS